MKRENSYHWVHRAIRSVQRQYFDPPDLARMSGSSKYR
jgi:hypothetical protein